MKNVLTVVTFVMGAKLAEAVNDIEHERGDP
jgi:hypothetical protein